MKVLEPSLNDEDVARLEHATFQYFADEVNLENGLVRDSTKRGSPASIAAVGFALTAYPSALLRQRFRCLPKAIGPGPELTSGRNSMATSLCTLVHCSFITCRTCGSTSVVLPSLGRLNKDFPEITNKYGFKCSYIVRGLRCAGFRGGWLGDTSCQS
jgi:hypothetical protein